ncbi:hypothetical protein Nepgr_014836 [Nepenthes gracilis]|uniref:Uncharacterized protein n=1 Tax=Nepenthes gracilis TaxID=150966 RepID=A0AAD3SJZ9_NEPGR|nr:hypothetical protein Nepgr_014836 [Nepenthes gracilis]
MEPASYQQHLLIQSKNRILSSHLIRQLPTSVHTQVSTGGPSNLRWQHHVIGYNRQATKPTSCCSISINTKQQRNLGLFNQKVVTTKSAYSLNHFNSYEVTAARSSHPTQPSKTEGKPGNALSKAASDFMSPNGQCVSNGKGKKTGTTSGNPMHVSIVAKLQP